MSKLRPNLGSAKAGDYCPTGGTAYLLVYQAVEQKDRLVHGKLHHCGDSCAIGSLWDVQPKLALHSDFIDEVAAVNDSVPNKTPRQRRAHVLRWLQWKLASIGMPGFEVKK